MDDFNGINGIFAQNQPMWNMQVVCIHPMLLDKAYSMSIVIESE